MKLKTFFFLLLFTMLVKNTIAKGNKTFTELHFIPHAGLSWQSTLFKPVFDFSYSPDLGSSFFPYNYERNTQGFGLDLGYSLTTNIASRQYLGFKTNGRFRYDYFYGGVENSPNFSATSKTIMLDYSTSLLYVLQNHKGRDWTASVGFTINQIGKQRVFNLSATSVPYYALLDYQYTSFNLDLGYDLLRLGKKVLLHTEMIFNYIPKGHPQSIYSHFMSLGLRATVRFKPGKVVWINEK